VTNELFTAISRGDADFVHQYLENGWPLNIADEAGSPPLHEAVYQGDEHIIQLLILYQVPIDNEDAFGNTPLHVASSLGEYRAAEILLKHGADVDKVTAKRSWTPLMLALNNRHITLISLLLGAGANIHYQDPEEGWTPLMVACEQQLEEAAIYLIQKGADVTACLTAGDTRGRNALELVSYHGDELIARELLKHGADVNHQPADGGLTALHWAVYNGHFDLTAFLLSQGANPNIPALGTYQGRTALHYAASAGRPDLVEILMKHGGDPLQPDQEARSPLQLATDHKVNTYNRAAYEYSVKLMAKT